MIGDGGVMKGSSISCVGIDVQPLYTDHRSIAARRHLGLGADDVQAAFVKWLRPENLVRVSQGPAPQ